MSDVAAVRILADEHHLEFVDLDRFNVDASAASVIPIGVARRHHVVPIGRKFGAPVVAMSNPGDVVAMDTLRAVIGREFVAVVASDDQISSCLARVYGPEAAAAAKVRHDAAEHALHSGPASNGTGERATKLLEHQPAPRAQRAPTPAPPPPPPAAPSHTAPPSHTAAPSHTGAPSTRQLLPTHLT